MSVEFRYPCKCDGNRLAQTTIAATVSGRHHPKYPDIRPGGDRVSQSLSDHMVPAARSSSHAEVGAGEFGAFYKRWHAQLLDFVKTTCGVRDAEEITQETFARALVNLDLSRDVAGQWRWLRVVARNVAADLGRSRKLCDVASDASCDVERVAAINVEQQLLDSECLQELHHVLTALSPKQSQAWWLTIAEGMPPTAIAATMGCSPESVRQALFKTRRKLASAMSMFVERAESFGAVGVLAVIARRVRKLTRPVTNAATPAPLALAAAGVVGTLAILSVPAHLGSTVHMPKTTHPMWHAAADTRNARSAQPAEPRHASGATVPRQSMARIAATTAITPPAATASVSHHPLSAGNTATVRVGVTTPYGYFGAQETLDRHHGDGVACSITVAVTCN
jgi:RNA polymerase sigma-70 factor, ECF subfamily